MARYLGRPSAGSSSDGSIRGPPSCHEPPLVLSNTCGPNAWALGVEELTPETTKLSRVGNGCTAFSAADRYRGADGIEPVDCARLYEQYGLL